MDVSAKIILLAWIWYSEGVQNKCWFQAEGKCGKKINLNSHSLASTTLYFCFACKLHPSYIPSECQISASDTVTACIHLRLPCPSCAINSMLSH